MFPFYSKPHHSQKNLNCLDQRLSTKLGGSGLSKGSEASQVKANIELPSMLWAASVVRAGTQGKPVVSKGAADGCVVGPVVSTLDSPGVWKCVKWPDPQKALGAEDKRETSNMEGFCQHDSINYWSKVRGKRGQRWFNIPNYSHTCLVSDLSPLSTNRGKSKPVLKSAHVPSPPWPLS